MREVYPRRRDVLARAVTEHAPDLRPRAAEAAVPAALVLGFGNVSEERILRGVDVLREAMSEQLR